MCGYICIGFIDFMLQDKFFVDCINLFHRKNDKIILKYFR